MTYVIFENNNEIDKTAITTMGVSVKNNDTSIGYFGTGLKFSIACLLRNNCSVSIASGEDLLNFTSESKEIRGSDFNIVLMNGHELGFTTLLGRDWELWQSFRELYSNCLDEEGRTYLSDTIPKPQKGKTIISVEGSDFIKEYENMDMVFISKDEEPLESNNVCEVYKGQGVFYRGVRVMEQVSSLMRYNVLNKIDLTEDRTARYTFQVYRAIASAIAKSNDVMFIEKAVTSGYNDCIEGRVSLEDVLDKPSDAYMNTVESLIKSKITDLNDDAKTLYERFAPKIEPTPIEVSDIEQQQLLKALSLCKRLGFPADTFPIDVYETLGDHALAAAHTHKDGKNIMLSKEIFSKGVMTLTRGLIEKYIHLQYGYDDYTLEMQNFIFDKMTHFGMQSIGEVV